MALEAANDDIDNANCLPGFLWTGAGPFGVGKLQDNLMTYIYEKAGAARQ